jgi:DNA-binding transcriptional regulator YhcF (GntR family)
MKNTSIMAYDSIQKELTSREMKVYEKVLTFPGITQRETAEKLGVPVHTISGRFTALENKGIIKVIGEKKIGNRNHGTYSIVEKQTKLF